MNKSDFAFVGIYGGIVLLAAFSASPFFWVPWVLLPLGITIFSKP